jgi:hypothetical protein
VRDQRERLAGADVETTEQIALAAPPPLQRENVAARHGSITFAVPSTFTASISEAGAVKE